jgi:hypothetical protein
MASRSRREPDRAGEVGVDFQVDPYLVIVTIEPLTPAGKTWIEENTEPWQWQHDRLCVEHSIASDILSHIDLDGLSYEGTTIEIPDDVGAGERLIQERNWVRGMQKAMPDGAPRRDDAVALIEQALRQLGFQIQ